MWRPCHENVPVPFSRLVLRESLTGIEVIGMSCGGFNRPCTITRTLELFTQQRTPWSVYDILFCGKENVQPAAVGPPSSSLWLLPLHLLSTPVKCRLADGDGSPLLGSDVLFPWLLLWSKIWGPHSLLIVLIGFIIFPSINRTGYGDIYSCHKTKALIRPTLSLTHLALYPLLMRRSFLWIGAI